MKKLLFSLLVSIGVSVQSAAQLRGFQIVFSIEAGGNLLKNG